MIVKLLADRSALPPGLGAAKVRERLATDD